ncbi:MAG: ECF transporter S component [Anaerolineae bacterium]|nr:ECF transporter S component [Anaerolineae bacterium]
MSAKNIRLIALVAVMMAVTATLTLVVKVPIPATGGYIHLGDLAANFAALAFGPWLGALIAGGGMAIADLIGFPPFAPGTLVVHGLQAVVVGYLGRRARPWMMFVAALAGGVVVVVGYFLYEWIFMQMGVATAVKEIPFNIIQVLSGLVGVPVYVLVAQSYPPIKRWAEKS